MATTTEPQQPKAFLSYSWSSPEYAERVVDLANRLRVDGIDVVLDRAHLTEGQDTDVFMERSVNDPTVTHVLLLCDPTYVEKADGRAGGVGKETTIVSSEVYASATQSKFVPIIMERRDDGSVPRPAYLKTRLYFDLSDPETEELHYQRLKRRLHGRPDLELAPLGKRPPDVDEQAQLKLTAHTPTAFIAAATGHRPQRWALLEDYSSKLVEAVSSERIGPGLSKADEIRNLHLASIESFRIYRDEFVEVMRTIARHGDEGEAYDRLHRLFEDLAAVVWDERLNHYSDDFARANLSFIVRELFMYALVVLLDAQRFSGMQRLLSRYYVASGLNDRGTVRSVEALDGHPGCIETEYGARHSNTGKLLRERATLARVDVAALRDIELVCVIRSRLDASYDDAYFLGNQFWWPRLQGPFGFAGSELRIVARLKDPHFRAQLSRVFDADSAEALRLRIVSLPDLPREYSALAWTNAAELLGLFGFPK